MLQDRAVTAVLTRSLPRQRKKRRRRLKRRNKRMQLWPKMKKSSHPPRQRHHHKLQILDIPVLKRLSATMKNAHLSLPSIHRSATFKRTLNLQHP